MRLKGITFAFVAFLFSCQRTGLAERAARLPDPLVRVKRNVFNALRRERIPSDPDTCTTFGAAGAEKIGLLNCSGRLTAGTADSRSLLAMLSTSDRLHRVGNHANDAPGVPIPSFPAHPYASKVFAGVRVTVRFSESGPASGPHLTGSG